MHNVLKAFTKNLVHNSTELQPKGPETLSDSGRRTDTGAEGKRRAVTRKITAAILEKITQMGSGQDRGLKTALTNRPENGNRPVPPDEEGTRFAYTSVDGNGEKHTLNRFVKDADLLTDLYKKR